MGEHITVGGLGATTVGTPAQVADNMEKWVKEADVDGFNLVSHGVGICQDPVLTSPGIRDQAGHLQGCH